VKYEPFHKSKIDEEDYYSYSYAWRTQNLKSVFLKNTVAENYSSIILAHFNKYSGEQSYGLAYTIKF
jgi:hypothetical protein